VLIRRSKLGLDLRTLPIDGFDMFLLTRVEGAAGATSINELVAVTPRAPLDTMQRVEQLVRLGLLEVEGEPSEGLMGDGARPLSVADDPITLKPPPRHVAFDDAQTLRPPRPGQARPARSVEIIGGRAPRSGLRRA
jgi:hypothetical protein